MKVFGLTGGVASGKSLAARIFQENDVAVLDADQVSRDITNPGGEGYEPVLKHFGTVDRAKLRHLVFTNPRARAELEAILHPLIQKETQQRLDRFRAMKYKLAVYEAALLVETGRYQDFDGLIVVTAPWDDRKLRLMGRDACPPEMAEAILRAQLSDEDRVRVADFVIENDTSPEEFEEKVKALIPKLMKWKGSPRGK